MHCFDGYHICCGLCGLPRLLQTHYKVQARRHEGTDQQFVPRRGILVSLMLALTFSEVIVLVTLYTVFVGLVLYLVLALSDPFQGDIGVNPTAFEYLVETLQSEIR